MANEVNLYDRRNMLRALHEAKPPRAFIINTFFDFANRQVFDTETVDVDIKKSKRLMAEFQSPHIAGKVVEKEGYYTVPYKPGYLKPKSVTTAQDLLKRQFGENRIYGPGESPMAMANRKLGMELGRLRESIIRKIELMGINAIDTGKVVVEGDGIEMYVIDFMRLATHSITLTGTDRWDQTGSNPIGNLKTWRRLIAKDSGMSAQDAVFGADAWDVFAANSEVKAQLDKRRINLGEIEPEERFPGVTYQGMVEGIRYWTYDEWYYNQATKQDSAMMPAKKVFLGSVDAYCPTVFGAIQDLKVTAAVDIFPKSWEEEDPSIRFLMLQSAPITALSQADAFTSAKVIS